MLNWIRGVFKHSSVSRPSSSTVERNDTNRSSGYCDLSSSVVMHAEQLSQPTDFKLILHVIHEGDIWIAQFERTFLVSELINLAVAHFIDPKDCHILSLKYKLISVLPKKVLNPESTLRDEDLNNHDEIVLVSKKQIDLPTSIKLSVQDTKGPSKEEIAEATAHLNKQNSILVVPSFDCQESFQSEIRKVLYSLVEASAKVLAQSPDAQVVFDGIAARINAKNKKELDKNAVKYLKDLGFTEVQAKFALRLKRNRQIEAMEWLLENSHRVKEEPEENLEEALASSLNISSPNPNNPLHTIDKLLRDIRDFHYRHFEPNPKTLETLKNMGFSEDDAMEALRVTGNNQVAACEWLCGERDPRVTQPDAGLDPEGTLYKALMNNPAIQLGLHNPKIMLAFLSILENSSTANLWLNDVDTAPVLGQVFKTYHSEKHILVVNQQMELIKRQQDPS
uniref:UBA domain-containing protein n=3 Tax=Graphocephala atropunctata TaxID=36148 RepID=A0A1B6KU45_9HEMI